MLFLEQAARQWLIVHLVLAAALVASATHLVVWLWGFWRGRFSRLRGVRRFAWIVAILYVANFTVGLLIYPVYKVRVRVDYLENPEALRAEYRMRGIEDVPDVPPTYSIARWFDVKEHWIALGLPTALACLAIVLAWNPNRQRDSQVIARPVVGLALCTASLTWAVAIIGAVVASYRSIGTL